jgi:cytochrome c peroxidase
MFNRLLSISVFLLILSGCQADDEVANSNLLDDQLAEAISTLSPTGNIDYFVLPYPENLGDIPQDPNNRLTEEKVALGQLLYHEAALGNAPEINGGLKTYSCASCHHVAAGFQAGVKQGLGEGGSGFGARGEARVPDPSYQHDQIDLQPIRTPTALNVAFQDVMLWNGQFGGTGTNEGTEAQWTADSPMANNHLGFEGVETQAIAGLKVHRQEATEAFYTDFPSYKTQLIAAFPHLNSEDKLSNIGIGLAIAAYERTLLPTEAPFQKWLRGEKAELGQQAKRGALVFFGKGNCASCHTGPALNSTEFYALGMSDLDALLTNESNAGFVRASLGRGGFTKSAADNYKFKVPQLYNLSDHQFFGHGASFESIREVIVYKNKAQVQRADLSGHPNLAKDFVPLNLTETEINDLVIFLAEGLHDPLLTRYVPDQVLSGGCIPVNDAQSKEDLGCGD